jgi:hypothetical protein
MTTTGTNYFSEASDLIRMRPRRNLFPLLLAGATAGTGITGESRECPSPSMTHQRPPQAWVFYAACEGELENPPEMIARILWVDREMQPEPEATIWRGVFAPSYQHRVLFSESVEIQTAKLPRWKPRVTIDRRTLERAEDE